MRKRHHSRTLASLATVLALVAAACGTEAADETSTTSTALTTTTSVAAATTSTEPPTTTTTEPALAGHAVYLLLEELDEEASGPFLVPVYRELAARDDTAMAVVESLLAGPTTDEIEGMPAISTAIPAGTQVLDVEIDGATATVDLSSQFEEGGGSASMFARLAQVVYTLTRLPDIDAVTFEIEGETVDVFSSEGIDLDGPQTRDGYYDWLPSIFVDFPAWGEPVTSPVRVTGLSNVFEAVSQVMLTDDDGAPLLEETVMASCGTGCWGDWEIEIPYTIDREQFGALIVWEFSAKDGSRINIREYPVQLGSGQ